MVEFKTILQTHTSYFWRECTAIMTNIEAFAHIIDLANRTTDRTTYDFLMKEAQEIMSDAKTEDISYCDFAEEVNERLANKLQRSKLN